MPAPAVLYNVGMKKPIKQCTLSEISDLVKEAGFPAFRTKQLIEWLYRRNIESYDEISNLPKGLINHLKEEYPLHTATIFNRQVSSDGTRKYLLKLFDGNLVETVAIPSLGGRQRLTVCFSTQVGCPMKCAFCATGHEGFTRNLGMGEIIDQIHAVSNDFGERVTNLVGMGQGEPFLNYRPTFDALTILNDEKFDNIGARHITVSTCGILAGIDLLAKDPHQYTMAISLHSAVQSTRDELMPIVARYPLDQLRSHIQGYIAQTNRRVTFEYLLIKDINDSEAHLKALVSYCKNLLCHVNLLPMNAVASSPYQPSDEQTVQRWMRVLQSQGIETSLRTSRGADIDGACGQLKNAMGR